MNITTHKKLGFYGCKNNIFPLKISVNILNKKYVTDAEVLRSVNKEPEVMKNIKSRKLQYFGHILRGDKY